jgi:hypothetical protein
MNKLRDATRRRMLELWASEECYEKSPAPVVLDGKYPLYQWIADYFGADALLCYLEFGVAQGDSMNFFTGHFSNPATKFYGFDSFQGLPEAWLHLPQFHFNNRGVPPRIEDSRVTFVKGWFQNTIPPFLSEWQKPEAPVLIHYDADLYGSTLFALTMIWPHIREYHFIMDDFTADDAVALFDFASAYPVEIEFLAQGGRDGNGKARPVKVFGRMHARNYEPKRSE